MTVTSRAIPPCIRSVPHMGQPHIEIEGRCPWLMRAGDPNYHFVTVRLPIADLPAELEGRRILFVTDIHLRDRWEPVLDAALPRFRDARPDLTLIGGDFVDDKKDHRAALPFVHRFLDGLPTPGKTFAVTGNHDGPKLSARIRSWPVEILLNERRIIDGIELIALGDHRKTSVVPSVLSRFPPRQHGLPRVVMCHYPYVVGRASRALGQDLYLAGHTHGGQVCLPNGRALVSHDALPKRYVSGVHRWDDGWLLVSRGLGFSSIELRTFCPPEAHLIVLGRANG